jgi:hypothetical protein
MKKRQREAIVAALDARLQAEGSWCGETHLQKSMFFLQELLEVPTQFPYVFYKFGPFSRDLRAELGSMRADGYLELVPQPAPYGPKLHVTDAAEIQLIARWPKTMARYEARLDFVAEQLGQLGVGTLERLATALWVSREMPAADVTEQARRIHALKPHVSLEHAEQAIERVAAMRRDAEQLVAA